MKVKIWGSQGSLPASIDADTVYAKITRALEAAQSANISTPESREAFIKTLPFSIRGTYGTNTPCVEVESGLPNEIILCDAGTGIRDFACQFIRSPQANRPTTFHIFMSHLHCDHIQGFPFFFPAFNEKNKIIFHGFHQETQKAIRLMMSEPIFPISFDYLKASIAFDIREPGYTFELNGLTIKTILQKHPGDSYGYRFEKNNKAFVYSTDCEHNSKIDYNDYPFVAFFKDADAVLFDGQYSLVDASLHKESWGHSSSLVGVDLAAHSKVKHLVIFHHEPTSSDEQLDKFLQDTIKYKEIDFKNKEIDDVYPKKISFAYDGLVLDL